MSFPNRYVLAVTASLVTLSLIIGCGGPTGSLDPRMAPRNLNASFDGDSVVLEWDPSELGTEESYEVWRNEYGNEYEKIADLTVTELYYKDIYVDNGEYYDYKITAIYENNDPADSDEATVYTGFLWMAGWDPPLLYKVDPNTGTILCSIRSPCVIPAGLAWDGVNLWNSDLWGGLIYKIDPETGTVLNSFNSPGENPRGLTYDGSSLWVSDYELNMVYKIEPNNGSVLTSFNLHFEKPSELGWDGEFLWAACYEDEDTQILLKINPDNGESLNYFECNRYSKGLSHDGIFLWNKHSDALIKWNPVTGEIANFVYTPIYHTEGLAMQR